MRKAKSRTGLFSLKNRYIIRMGPSQWKQQWGCESRWSLQTWKRLNSSGDWMICLCLSLTDILYLVLIITLISVNHIFTSVKCELCPPNLWCTCIFKHSVCVCVCGNTVLFCCGYFHGVFRFSWQFPHPVGETLVSVSTIDGLSPRQATWWVLPHLLNKAK